MDWSTALGLAILLLQRIQIAKAAGVDTIEIDDLGETFADINARIQAARAAEGPPPEDTPPPA